MEYHKKGWGYELWIVNKPEYCGKLLKFEKGKRCSLHYHKEKDETFYLQSGRLLVEMGIYVPDNDHIWNRHEHILTPGQTLHIPQFIAHRMTALEDSELLEFSTQHFEDDSYRIEKGD